MRSSSRSSETCLPWTITGWPCPPCGGGTCLSAGFTTWAPSSAVRAGNGRRREARAGFMPWVGTRGVAPAPSGSAATAMCQSGSVFPGAGLATGLRPHGGCGAGRQRERRVADQQHVAELRVALAAREQEALQLLRVVGALAL